MSEIVNPRSFFILDRGRFTLFFTPDEWCWRPVYYRTYTTRSMLCWAGAWGCFELWIMSTTKAR